LCSRNNVTLSVPFSPPSIDLFATAKAAPFLRECYDNIADKAQKVLTNMPLGLKVMGADYPILRVFASWPGEAKLMRSMDYKENKKARDEAEDDEDNIGDPDKHPLATLNLEKFNKFSEALDSNWQQKLLLRKRRKMEARVA
jgi:hypothetical protein